MNTVTNVSGLTCYATTRKHRYNFTKITGNPIPGNAKYKPINARLIVSSSSVGQSPSSYHSQEMNQEILPQTD